MDSTEHETLLFLSKKRQFALLTGLKGTCQEESPAVAELMEHRERLANINTAILKAVVSQEQEQSKEQAQERQKSLLHTVQASAQALRRRRVPVLTQMSMVECGAACLAMLLSYYGRKTSVSEVNEYCRAGRDGLSALSIVKAARMYNMRVRAISLQENDFRFVTLPAIVHWEFNHFLIVEQWTPKYVEVVDPALGRRRILAEEFDTSFTGVVVMLEPGVNFDRRRTSTQVNLRTYALSYVKQAPLALLQVIGASLLLQLFGLAVPLLTAVVIDTIIPLKMTGTLVLLGVGLLILVLAQLVVTLLRALVLLYLQTKIDTRMMLSFFEKLLSLPLRFFQQRSSGDILTRLSSNIAIRDIISDQIVSTVLDGSFVLVYLLILLWLSPVFGVLALGLGLLQVILLVSTNRPIRDLANRALVAQGKSQGYLTEALTGIATLKAAGAEQHALEQWSNLFFDEMNTSVRLSYFYSLIGTAMSILSTFSPLLLLWIGAMQVINGSMHVGTMLALNALVMAFLTPLDSLVSSGQRLQLVHSHLERIADVMQAEPEQGGQAVLQPPRLTGQIELKNVCFQYDPHSPDILHDINVRISPGQKVAIVGRTGSGKSTLGRLLLGLYLPTTGDILYDDIPLHRLNYQAVRAQFGVVMQDSSIFSGSVRQNIALNAPDMDMERIIKAAQAAAIHDDIMLMPMEYETFVSEGGSALSGGQRQRLALARALAHDPALLLLDEATSSLDVMTEHIVEQNLHALSCTQIIIAHRLSTIRNADLILVLDQGTIVERGSHQELLRRNGYYAELIQSQLASGEIKQEVRPKSLLSFRSFAN